MYLNLNRLCFSVPYALSMEKIDKKSKKKSPTCLLKCFEHITSNTHIFTDLSIKHDEDTSYNSS